MLPPCGSMPIDIMTPQLQCPNCQSSQHRVILWDVRNWLILLGELCLLAVELVFGSASLFNGLPLYRRCRECGKRFRGARELQRNYDECASCGYNLTGNVTGRCPECGWKLTRRFRAHRKKVDRNLGTSRKDPS